MTGRRARVLPVRNYKLQKRDLVKFLKVKYIEYIFILCISFVSTLVHTILQLLFVGSSSSTVTLIATLNVDIVVLIAKIWRNYVVTME